MLEWEAYDTIEPIGAHRDDWHAASICAAVMNAMAIQIRSKKRFRVKDFLLEFGDPGDTKDVPKEGKQENWKNMKFIAQMFVAQANADVNKKKKRRR